MLEFLLSHPWYDLAAALTIYVVWRSFRRIGPTEVGLVTKRFSWKKLSQDSPVAFDGEAGYQADLLMPGLRWKLWLLELGRRGFRGAQPRRAVTADCGQEQRRLRLQD